MDLPNTGVAYPSDAWSLEMTRKFVCRMFLHYNKRKSRNSYVDTVIINVMIIIIAILIILPFCFLFLLSFYLLQLLSLIISIINVRGGYNK